MSKTKKLFEQWLAQLEEQARLIATMDRAIEQMQRDIARAQEAVERS